MPLTMENNIDKLREMTNNLPPIISIEDLKAFSSDNYVEFDVRKGKSFSTILFKKEEVSVARVFLSKGTVFPEVTDPVHKVVILFEGLTEVNPCIDGKKIRQESRVLKPGDHISFGPDEHYGGVALEDSWLISVSVPSSILYKK